MIHYTILSQKLEVLHHFLTLGANVNLTCDSDWTPLHLAAHLGLADYVEMLLFFRAKVDIADNFGVLSSLP
jgi:ankyrin repeat protein